MYFVEIQYRMRNVPMWLIRLPATHRYSCEVPCSEFPACDLVSTASISLSTTPSGYTLEFSLDLESPVWRLVRPENRQKILYLGAGGDVAFSTTLDPLPARQWPCSCEAALAVCGNYNVDNAGGFPLGKASNFDGLHVPVPSSTR